MKIMHFMDTFSSAVKYTYILWQVTEWQWEYSLPPCPLPNGLKGSKEQ